MKSRNDDGMFDMDWWATADLEGVNDELAHDIVRQMATDHYLTPGALPDMDMLDRVQVNMQKWVARRRRADTVAQAQRLLAIAAALASAALLLWQVNRLLA